MKVEIVFFWGDEVSARGESRRLAEVIQPGFALGASMQTPDKSTFTVTVMAWATCGALRSTPSRKDRVSGTPSFDGMALSIQSFRLHQA